MQIWGKKWSLNNKILRQKSGLWSLKRSGLLMQVKIIVITLRKIWNWSLNTGGLLIEVVFRSDLTVLMILHFRCVLVPPRIIHTNSPQTTVVYADVTLTCQSTGDPAPSLQWLNPIGQEVMSSSAYVMIANTLQIASANDDTDGGHWTCRACNLLGCDEAMIEVKIEGKCLDKANFGIN